MAARVQRCAFRGPRAATRAAAPHLPADWARRLSSTTPPEADAAAAPKADAASEATPPEADDAAAADAAAPGEGHEEEGDEPAAPSELDDAKAKVASLQDEIKTLKEQMLRALADAENARVIARRDIQNEREFAIQKFAKSLLDVADNLERAIDSVPADAREAPDASPALLSLLEGVEMTSAQLGKTFAESKLVKVGAVGDKFDPSVHEALFSYEDPEKEPMTIGQMLKVGYKLNERVIRPAQVGTVKAPAES